MSTFTCSTQAELDAAIKKAKKYDYIELVGTGYFEVTASGSAQVTAYDSAQVRASGSAQVRASGSAQVTAYGSAQVTAYGSAQVTASGSAQVTAYDSAQVRAYGSAQVRAYGSAQVTASKFVAVTLQRTAWGKPKVTGGVVIEVPETKTVADWIEYHGLTVKRGLVTLYKAVDDDYATDHSRAKDIAYTPGSKPEAPDWDGGKAECGGGLHFVSKPVDGLRFNESATRFVACPVKVSEIAFHADGDTTKVKAPRVVGPIVEVDINGEPVKA
jgi:hypothetical protein